MKKQNLNEEVTRIKNMMGLSEQKTMDELTLGMGDSNFNPEPENQINSDDIDWDWDNAYRSMQKSYGKDKDFVRVYGVGYDDGKHYKGTISVHDNGYGYEPGEEQVNNIEIDDSWEPDDDQIFNQPGMEGGIRY